MALSTDESFATVAESEAYGDARGWTDWNTTTPPSSLTKEQKLREATDYILATFYWPNQPASSTQVLPFPMYGLYDRYGRALTGIPTQLKAATIEAARLALTGSLLGGDAAAAATQTIKRERIGPLETEFSETSYDEVRDTRLAMVHALLRSIGGCMAGGVNVRLSKA